MQIELEKFKLYPPKENTLKHSKNRANCLFFRIVKFKRILKKQIETDYT